MDASDAPIKLETLGCVRPSSPCTNSLMYVPACRHSLASARAASEHHRCVRICDMTVHLAASMHVRVRVCMHTWVRSRSRHCWGSPGTRSHCMEYTLRCLSSSARLHARDRHLMVKLGALADSRAWSLVRRLSPDLWHGPVSEWQPCQTSAGLLQTPMHTCVPRVWAWSASAPAPPRLSER